MLSVTTSCAFLSLFTKYPYVRINLLVLIITHKMQLNDIHKEAQDNGEN